MYSIILTIEPQLIFAIYMKLDCIFVSVILHLVRHFIHKFIKVTLYDIDICQTMTLKYLVSWKLVSSVMYIFAGIVANISLKHICEIDSIKYSQYSFLHWFIVFPLSHYDDVIMGAMASQITSRTIIYSTVFSGADQSKHQSSASLAFVWGIHRGPVNSPQKWPVTRKMFPVDDVIMNSHCFP